MTILPCSVFRKALDARKRSGGLPSIDNQIGGAGRKGGKNRRKRTYNQVSSSEDSRLFTEYYHNENPFIVINKKDIKLKKVNGKLTKPKCPKCEVELGVKIVIKPHDIALSHRERWKYPNPDAHLPNEERTKISVLETEKYYCIQRDCIFTRFPYFATFGSKLLEISDNVTLNSGQKNLILRELDVDVDTVVPMQ